MPIPRTGALVALLSGWRVAREEREAIYKKTEFVIGFVGGLGLLGGLAVTGTVTSLVFLAVLAAVLVVGGLSTDVLAPRWRFLGVGVATGIVGVGIGTIGGLLVLTFLLSGIHIHV